MKQVELSKKEFPECWKVLEAGLQEEVAPGFVVGFWSHHTPDEIRVAACGQRRIFPTELPMTVDTVFDLASVTKVFATATLTALLVQRGWLHWDDSVALYWPSWRFPEIRIRHLLSHTAGYPAYDLIWEKLRKTLSHACAAPLHQVPIAQRQAMARDFLSQINPEVAVDVRVLYSDLSFMILGFVLEEILQMPLDQAVMRLLWKPMGIQNAFYQRIQSHSYRAVQRQHFNVAATEQSDWRGGVLQGQVHDENCWAMGGYAGHAGAFATVHDLLHFGKQLLLGFLDPAVLREMWSRYRGVVDCSRTLGWDTPHGDSPAVGTQFFQKAVGHLGFTGTSFWIDPESQHVIAVLSNRVHFAKSQTQAIRSFRTQFHNALGNDLCL